MRIKEFILNLLGLEEKIKASAEKIVQEQVQLPSINNYLYPEVTLDPKEISLNDL
jgi:hypothetical protein